MEIQALYRPLEQLELAASDLYEEFARVFGREDAEAGDLFSMLAREEKSHHALIQFEKRLFKHNPSLTWETGLLAEHLAEAIAKAEGLKRRATKLTLCEAVTAALELEESGAEQACHSPKGNVPEELTSLIAKLRSGDQAHRAALEEFAKRRGFLKSAP